MTVTLASLDDMELATHSLAGGRARSWAIASSPGGHVLLVFSPGLTPRLLFSGPIL